MLKFRIPIVAVVAGLALPVLQVEGSPSSIGVFFDSDATDCDISVVPGTIFNVYVCAVLGTDAAAAGIMTAEFRVDGLSGIVSSVTPNPASSLSMGDPTTIPGCDIDFPSCTPGNGPRNALLLYTITCSIAQPAAPRTVAVERFFRPSDVLWAPVFVLCDAPMYTPLFVSGGQAFINNGSCAVGVQPTTWSIVKSIFASKTVLQPTAPHDGQR